MTASAEAASFAWTSMTACSGWSIPTAAAFSPRASTMSASIRTTSAIPIAIPYADACRAKYGSQHIWRAAAADRLASWNFNTLGCWSDELVAGAGSSPLAITPTVELGASFKLHRRDQVFPDVFDPAFAAHIRRTRQRSLRKATQRRRSCSAPSSTTNCTGRRTGAAPTSLLTLFLNLPSHRPGRVAAIATVAGALSGILAVQCGLADAGAIMGGARHDGHASKRRSSECRRAA